MNASYPDHLREEVERYLQGMRFSEEAITATSMGRARIESALRLR